MYVQQVSINDAVGHILLHNQFGSDKKKVFGKGHQVTAADVAKLESLGKSEVYVAILETGDVTENEAARRLGEQLTALGVTTTNAATGRVNLLAETAGLVKVNQQALFALNEVDGITLATVTDNTIARPRKMLATLKIIPYAVSEDSLFLAEKIILDQQPLLSIKPFLLDKAVLITTGSEVVREKIANDVIEGLRPRLAAYNAELHSGAHVAENESDISEAIKAALDEGFRMVLIAGETSIMDADDVTPRAIRAIGGEVVHHGVPVEPGNLFMLGYYYDVPIVGAPGCARMKGYNVVDMVLPRLATGERMGRQDLVALGYGGYLK